MSNSNSYHETRARFFRKAGPVNTRDVLESIARRADELSIDRVLIPTCSGKTAMEALEVLPPDFHIVAVTHVTGFQKPDHQELDSGVRKDLESKGVTVFTGQHAFGGVGRAVRNKMATYQVDEIIANTLRVFGHGTKVAVELALMAADAGLIRTESDIVSAGGTMSGIDTALVLRPANSFHFFDLKVREVICKPAAF
ncbi:MAG: pyruvate kinase alpha/beta domain-containing protein [Thermodesulfobacteriota bacterium]